MTDETCDVRPSSDELLAVGATVCDICGASFPHTSARQLHVVKSHRIIKDRKDYSLFHRSRSKSVKRFFCPVNTCTYFDGAWFKSLGALKQHYQKCHLPKTLQCQFCPDVRFSLQRDRNYHEKICPLRPKSNAAPIATSSLTERERTLVHSGTDNATTKNESEVAEIDVVAESRADLREPTNLEEKRYSSAERSKFDQSVVKAWFSGKSTSFDTGQLKAATAAQEPSRAPIVFVCINSPRATTGPPASKLRKLMPKLANKPRSAATQVDTTELVSRRSSATQTNSLLEDMLNVSAQVDQVDLLGFGSAFDQQDFICQTVYPNQIDSGTQMAVGEELGGGGLDDSMICGGTQTDLFEFEELLRHTETQTLFPGGELADARTQTLLIDFIESGFTDAERAPVVNVDGANDVNGSSRSVGI